MKGSVNRREKTADETLYPYVECDRKSNEDLHVPSKGELSGVVSQPKATTSKPTETQKTTHSLPTISTHRTSLPSMSTGRYIPAS